MRTDPNLIADINRAVGNTLLSLSNDAGQPVRQGALSWLLSKYGIKAARSSGASTAPSVDPVQIAEEQELASFMFLQKRKPAPARTAAKIRCFGSMVLPAVKKLLLVLAEHLNVRANGIPCEADD